MEVSVINTGNSKGIRLPRKLDKLKTSEIESVKAVIMETYIG